MAVGVKYLRFAEIQKDARHFDLVTPDPRSGHRIIVDGGCVFSIGGYNPDFSDRVRVNDSDADYPLFKELWRFNYARRHWTKLKSHGSMPDALASHSALIHGHYLVVFGGTGVPFGEAASNQLYVCNLTTLEWTHIQCTGQLPICLYGHSLTLCDHALYLFGGTTGWEYNSDLHKLDLETYTWTALTVSGECPAGRYRHEVACYNNHLFIFGGGRSNTVYGFDTLPVINLSSLCWMSHPCQPDVTHGLPSARRCHSCVQVSAEVYMCGGYNGQVIFNDLWKLSLETLHWTLLPAKLPEPVYFHSAAVTNTGLMFIYGGVTQIDSRRTSKIFATWLRVPTLKELCWQTVLSSLTDITTTPRQTLTDIGIPMDLAELLN
jgi:hypothetical protein